jgi:hypothetical protein
MSETIHELRLMSSYDRNKIIEASILEYFNDNDGDPDMDDFNDIGSDDFYDDDLT